LNDITKGENVKLDEIKWMGLDDFLKGKKNVTKQEVQDFVTGNRLDVQEIGLSDTGLRKKFSVNSPLDQDFYDVLDKNNYVVFTGKEDDADYFIDRSQTKFGKYTLPGGENYREILLTLPQKETRTPNMIEYEKLGQQMFGGALNPTERARLDELENLLTREERSMALSGGKSKTSVYQSSHFDEPNILAHIRVNDRIDADGKKMLLVEEIQSDWHQAGREKGYKGKGTLKELPNNYFVQELKTIDGDTIYLVRDKENPSVVLNKDYNKQSAINGVINELNATSAGGVPDAPFKDTWYQLALKRALRYAADNGYDRVGLTTGKQQAERYDLSKQLSRVAYKDGRLQGYDNDGALVVNKPIDSKELKDYVGLDLGRKIALNAEKEAEVRTALRQAIKNDLPENQIDVLRNQLNEIPSEYSGLDLQVGGEGMKKYYDDVYPKFLEKYGKKWGASVGETQVDTVKERAENSMIPATRKEPVRYIDITPEMRKSVQKGQPLAAVSSESTVA
jgi:hypothetical protein